MRHKGAVSDFIPQRDRELILAYRRILARRDTPHIHIIGALVADSPASRFWVSEERATIVITAMLKNKHPLIRNPTKRDMYSEILNRVSKILSQNPAMRICDAVSDVVNSPAPKFYMRPRVALHIIYNLKKKCKYE